MENPWIKLPISVPYFLPDEQQLIQYFNASVSESHCIRPELMPEPFLGDINAPIVLLNLNPGFDDREIPFHNQNEYFIHRCRDNLLHKPGEYPFYLLDPGISESLGHKWWIKRLRDPIKVAGLWKVANKLFCVEYFPYHSKRFRSINRILDSQRYSFSLVETALQRNALVIIMRGKRLWVEAIPELIRYPKLFQLRNPRNVDVSQGNCPDGYQELTRILTNNSP